MEGTYFFGEHLRWNLGWSNPNQAGAFVAMCVPWLWGLGLPIQGSSRKVSWLSLLPIAAELVLWFLLCKTYSRGAFVAVALVGCVYFGLNRYFSGNRRIEIWTCIRLIGIGVLLWGTHFFARIEPGYLAKDPSAGNRLTLWKGGLQMMAASPWEGWGEGLSGRVFMQWFQPLEAKEAYAGMVNSYLHVGVERGIWVLAAVVSVLFGIWIFSVRTMKASRNDLRVTAWCVSSGGCWLVFGVVNVFSTLWIFANLWWLPGIAGLVLLTVGIYHFKKRACRLLVTSFSGAFLLANGMVAGLYAAGAAMKSDVQVLRSSDGKRVVVSANPSAHEAILVLPDSTVLGETWGKEIRRLAKYCPTLHIDSPVDENSEEAKEVIDVKPPQRIIACGRRATKGFNALKQFPNAELVIVHPLGKPNLTEDFTGNATVFLPGLDTSGGSRFWKALCQKKNWLCKINPGVGQDVRLIWPEVLDK